MNLRRIRRRRSGSGFTLIELLLVVVIIGILAAIVVPRLVGRSEEARIGAAKQQLSSFRSALSHYELDMGRYPTTDLGLQALMINPGTTGDPKKWKGPYLESQTTEVPKDPWGNAYIYVYPGAKNQNGYDLYCVGPDGVAGNEDDIYQ
ncbi:MAG TPA: type II secretion system major pseudopilin GspG [Planctomycetota bacterium]|jgi:general secretion pathway protein G|nr:type II secretion system major pseudopilin GspG [Planctomycetota bacterium]